MLFTVSNTAGLVAATKYATGGDTIALQSGNYDAVTLSNLAFNGAVTITSVDPNNPRRPRGHRLEPIAKHHLQSP